jgi:hypothetical protein
VWSEAKVCGLQALDASTAKLYEDYQRKTAAIQPNLNTDPKNEDDADETLDSTKTVL